jgi:hypothetical protein
MGLLLGGLRTSQMPNARNTCQALSPLENLDGEVLMHHFVLIRKRVNMVLMIVYGMVWNLLCGITLTFEKVLNLNPKTPFRQGT